MNVNSQDFRSAYANTDDSNLGNAPSDMYVATPLGQTSLVYPVGTFIDHLEIGNDLGNHGDWRFAIRACVDMT